MRSWRDTKFPKLNQDNPHLWFTRMEGLMEATGNSQAVKGTAGMQILFKAFLEQAEDNDVDFWTSMQMSCKNWDELKQAIGKYYEDADLIPLADRFLQSERTGSLEKYMRDALTCLRNMGIPLSMLSTTFKAADFVTTPDYERRLEALVAGVNALVRAKLTAGVRNRQLTAKLRDVEVEDLESLPPHWRKAARSIGLDPTATHGREGQGGDGRSQSHRRHGRDERERNTHAPRGGVHGGGYGGRSQSQRRHGRSKPNGHDGGKPRRPGESPSKGTASPKGDCYHCGKKGHYAAECPAKSKATLAVLGGPSPSWAFRGAKVNGEPAVTLVDSGCHISAIDCAFADKLGLKPLESEETYSGYDWNGVLVQSNKYVEVTYEANEFKVEKLPLVYVSCPAGRDVVLGGKFIRTHRIAVQPGDVEVATLDGTPLFYAHDNIDIKLNKLHHAAVQRHDGADGDDDLAQRMRAKVLDDYEDVFQDTIPQLPPHRGHFDFNINITDASNIPRVQAYRTSPSTARILRAKFDDYAAKGMIYYVDNTEPAYCPVFAVNKKPGPNGERRIRAVTDATSLNMRTNIKDTPFDRIRVDEQLHAVGDDGWFTRLDIVDAYFSLRVTEESEHLLTCVLPKPDGSKFRWRVMPQGAKASSFYLTQFMQNIFANMLDRNVVCLYADDILVHSPTLEQHITDVRDALQICRDNHLVVNPAKADLFVNHVHFLGHTLTKSSIIPDIDRLAGLATYPAPTNRHQLRRWLGGAQWFARHLPGISVWAQPLYALTSDNKPFVWNDEHQAAFERIKQLMLGPAKLAQPDPTKPFNIYTDASDAGFGAVIMQDEKPLAYLSQAASGAMANWPTAELELYAVRHALQSYPHWFSGADIHVWVDHSSLTHLKTVKSSKRLLRHFMAISEYGPQLHYVAGKHNELPDVLSRNPNFKMDSTPGPCPVNTAFRELEQHGELTIHPLLDQEFGGESEDDVEVTMLCSLTALDDHVITNIAPSDELKQLLLEDYGSDAFCTELLEALTPGKEADPAADVLVQNYELHGDLLYRAAEEDTPPRLVIPSGGKSINHILNLYHDEANHTGRNRLMAMLSSRFFVRKLSELVNRYIKSCPTCQKAKIGNRKPPGAARPLDVPRQCFDEISIDFVTGLPESGHEKYDSVLVAVDNLSKFVIYIPTRKDVTAEQTANLLLQHVAAHHGAFAKVHSDRGSVFTANVMRTILDRLGVLQSMATAHHAQSTGQAERYVRALVEALRVTLLSSTEDWHEVLPLIAMAMNAAPHSTTGTSPFQLCTGQGNATFYDLVLPLMKMNALDDGMRATLRRTARDSLEYARWVRAHAINRTRDLKTTFKPGDQVLVNQIALLPLEERDRNMRKLRYLRVGPYKIKKMQNRNAAVLDLPSRMKVHNVVNVSHLRHYRTDDTLRPANLDDPPLFSDKGDFYIVDQIVGHRYRRKKLQFLVRWRNYDSTHNSYVDPSDFYSRIHITDYCSRKGLPIPADAPPA